MPDHTPDHAPAPVSDQGHHQLQEPQGGQAAQAPAFQSEDEILAGSRRSEYLQHKRLAQAVGWHLCDVPMELRTRQICEAAVNNDEAAICAVPSSQMTLAMCQRVARTNPAMLSLARMDEDMAWALVAQDAALFQHLPPDVQTPHVQQRAQQRQQEQREQLSQSLCAPYRSVITPAGEVISGVDGDAAGASGTSDGALDEADFAIFAISYNWRDARIYGGATTAIVLGQGEGFLIFDGDWREQLRGKTFGQCLDFYRANPHLRNKLDEGGRVPQDAPPTLEAWKQALRLGCTDGDDDGEAAAAPADRPRA